MSSKSIGKNYYLLKKLSTQHKIYCIDEKVNINDNKTEKIIERKKCIVKIDYGKFIVEF